MSNSLDSGIQEAFKTLESLKGEFLEIDKVILEISKKARTMGNIAFENISPKSVNERIKQNSKEVTYLNETLKQQQKIRENLVKTLVKKEAALSKDNKALQKQRFELAELNKRAKESAILSSKISTEYQKQAVKLTRLRREYKDLAIRQEIYNDLTEDQVREMKQLEKQANKIDKALKKVDQSVGQSQRFVGEYQRGIKGLSQSFGVFNNLVGAFGVTLGTSLFIDFLKESNELAKTLEGRTRRATIVFGESLKFVNDQAKENARIIGTTKSEYIGAAAAVADLLVPLGFQRDVSAELATEVVNLSGALSDWVGGQYSATEVSEILQKAILGETEQLKQLGIVIDQSSKEYNNRIKDSMLLTGSTREQARALDILNQITSKSADAQRAFAEGASSIAIQQERANAQAREAKEAFAQTISPTTIGLTKAYSGVLSDLSLRATSLNEIFDDTNTNQERFAFTIKTLTGNLIPLPPLIKRWTDETLLAGAASRQTTLDLIDEAKAFIQLNGSIAPLTEEQEKDREQREKNILFLENEITKRRTLGAIRNDIAKEQQNLLEATNREEALAIQQRISLLEQEEKKIIGSTQTQQKEREKQITILNNLKESAVELKEEIGDLFVKGKIDAEQFNNSLNDIDQSIKDLTDGIDIISSLDSPLEGLSGTGVLAPEDLVGDTIDLLEDQLINLPWEDALLKATEFFGGVNDLAATLYDRNIQRIDDEIAANDLKYSKLLEAEGLTNEQRNALEAQQEAKRQELEAKKREELKKQAVTEKAFNTTQVIANTAVAISKTLAQTGVFGIPLTAIVAAQGALQLATVLAQPIPQYKTGRKGGREEYAILGDGGQHEPIIDKHGNLKTISPNVPTLMYLDRGDTVLPSVNDLSHDKLLQNGLALSAIEHQERLDRINKVNNTINIDSDKIGKIVGSYVSKEIGKMPRYKPMEERKLVKHIGLLLEISKR